MPTRSEEIDGLREQLAVEHGRLRALQDIGAASGSILDIDELLALVVSRISEVMDAERTTVFLLEEDGRTLVSKVAQGQGEESAEIRLTVGEGFAGWVAKYGELINVHDAYDDPRFDATWDEKSGYRTRSVLCAPMKNRFGRPIGVVQVLNKRDSYFSLDDEFMLVALSSQAAVTIENGRFFVATVQKNMELLETKQQLERKVRELDVFSDIALVSASIADLDQLLLEALKRSVRAMDCEAGAILLTDEKTGDLRYRCAVGGDTETLLGMSIPQGLGISGWVARNRTSHVANDVRKDPLYRSDISEKTGYWPRSVLAVPLHWEEGEGTLELLDKGNGRRPFAEEDIKFATALGGLISNVIGLAYARQRKGKQERLSTIGQLLSSILHDLKTPMTIISGYVEELVEEGRRAEREKFARSIARQVEIVNAMTKETLGFARGDRTLWVRKVYLAQFFEEIAAQLKRELEGRGISVELDLQDRGIARFDQHKLQRAIHNLARNAAEALGPAALRNHAGSFLIRVLRDAERSLVIECEDNGPGIPEAVRERLFESFATHGKEGGTGLGLAIVRKVVEDHHGTIQVDSAPGRTVFRMVFPQSPGAELETSPGSLSPVET